MLRSRLYSPLLFAAVAGLGALAGPLHNSAIRASAPVIKMVAPHGPGGTAPRPRLKSAQRRGNSRRISVAEAKRRACKRRNRLRHKHRRAA